MNKAQLVEAVALEANIPKIAARKAVDAMLRAVHTTLCEGERVSLTGFGSFGVIERSARMGRNPRTGASVHVPPRRQVRFRSVMELD